MNSSFRTESPTFRFLIGGGSAALINWLARIPLSLVLPFELSVLAAQAIGLAAGFVIYRNYVFKGHGGRILQQLPVFLGVNLLGAALVWVVSIAALWLLEPLLTSLPVTEAVAHAVGIATGAIANYVGHRHFTFRRARALRPVSQIPGTP